MIKIKKNNMNNIGISIVLGSYNRKRFLKKTIESIRNNRVNRPYEIIVIDGGSNDASVEYLTKQKDIITIIQHNHGIWKGKKVDKKSWGFFMNLGFKCTVGKYICMVSDDCLLPPNVIENGIREIEIQESKKEIVGGIAFYFRDWPIEKKYKIHYTYGNLLAINHGIYTKEALESVNYINEKDYQFYCADGDLSLKIWKKGFKIIKSSKCFVEHNAHAPSRMSHSSKLQYAVDQQASRDNWSELINKTQDLGKWESIEICDPNNTAKNFPRASIKAKLLQKIQNIKNKIRGLVANFKKI